MKIFSVLLASFLFLSFLLKISFAPSNLLANGSNFDVKCSSGHKLAFQSKHILKISVINGLLNGSSCSLQLYIMSGSFNFVSHDNCVFRVSIDTEEGVDFYVSGASSVSYDNWVWTVTIPSEQTIALEWSWRIESWIDKYFVFGLGVAGLIAMIVSPAWVAFAIRKKGVDENTLERFAYAFLIFIFGFCLVVVWLWG